MHPTKLLQFLPGGVLGVFLARILGEALGLPGEWAAVLLSSLLGVGLAFVLGQLSLLRTWPLLLALFYIFQPEVMPTTAGTTAAVLLVALGLNEALIASGRPTGSIASISARNELVIATLLTAVFLIIYVVTLAPGMLAADSGELQTVADQLGVAHPPGFPLYVMLAHLFTRLVPFLSPAAAVNFFSAVTSALTVGLVYLIAHRTTRRHIPAILAAVALGTATTFWSQATTANVRSLTGLFAAVILLALIQFRAAVHASNQKTASRWLIIAALGMGFGLTHHVSLAFLIIMALVFILFTDPALIRRPRRWIAPILAGLLGLLPLLYLPIRAGAEVRGASPNLATLPGFLEHVLATGFRGDLFYYTNPTELWPRIGVMGNVMTFQFAAILLAAMLAGFVLYLWRDRGLVWLLGGTFIVYALIAATYRAPQTVEYMIPAYIPAVLLLAGAAAWLLEQAGTPRTSTGPLAIALVSLLLVAAVGQFSQHLTASGAHHEADSVRNMVGPLLANAPPESTILAHWHWATPLWYLQEVEGQRPDVAVRFVYPDGESYETTWAQRIREAHATGRPVITTYVPFAPIDGLPHPEPFGEALIYQPEQRETTPADFSPAGLVLANTIEIVGYHLDNEAVITGDSLALVVAWRAAAELPPGTILFAHLVDKTGVLVAQDDQPVATAAAVNLIRFTLTPRPAAQPGTATLFLGLAAPTLPEPSRLSLTDINLEQPTDRPWTSQPLHRRVPEQNRTLIGFDWDHTLLDRARLYLHWQDDGGAYSTEVIDDQSSAALALPAFRGPWGIALDTRALPTQQTTSHYVPLGDGIVWTGETLDGLGLAKGESVVLRQNFNSGRPLNRDYVVSVRLIGLEPDGNRWAWWDLQDSVPAMGGIPTLKWIEGSFVRSPHRVTVQPPAVPGQTLSGALTLYDAFTNRPLPILDERITAETIWIPLEVGSVK